MKEISFVEYLKHFFTNVEVVNNEILNALEIDLLDFILSLVGVLFIACGLIVLVSNLFIKDDDIKVNENENYRFESIVFSLFLLLGGIFPIYGVLHSKVSDYNKLIKSIPEERYIFLAYTKDFLEKDDIEEAIQYMKRDSNKSTLNLYLKLNEKKESAKVKEVINLINSATKDGVVTLFEFKEIQKNLMKLEDERLSTYKEVEKVEKNLGVKINN